VRALTYIPSIAVADLLPRLSGRAAGVIAGRLTFHDVCVEVTPYGGLPGAAGKPTSALELCGAPWSMGVHQTGVLLPNHTVSPAEIPAADVAWRWASDDPRSLLL